MTTTTLTLADRITAAERAEHEPRKRVTDLSAELDSALASREYDAGAQLQPALDEARAELAMSEAVTRALRDGAQAVEAQRADDARKIQDAQARDQALERLNSSHAAEAQLGRDAGFKIDEMYGHLAAAQRAHAEACELERQQGRHRQEAADARALLAGEGSPTVAKPNRAAILAEHNCLIRDLLAWRPASQRRDGT